ncbi:MAG: hypothetical protein WD993_07230 [Thermoleophilaceae bacterium]
MRRERGQALVELIAGLPVVLVVGLALLQLLATGYSAVLAGSAAEAGALALAGGRDAPPAVRPALPGWAEAGARVEVAAESVRVLLRPPSPIGAVARKLEVTADAAVEIE